MSITFHCYLCDNADQSLIDLHREASRLTGLTVKYHVFKQSDLASIDLTPHQGHGWFMEQMLQNFPDKNIGFIDVDCIVSNMDFVARAEERVSKSGTMFGIAQSANHLPSRNEIYAAPAFGIINSAIWHELGKPSLIADGSYDTAQRLSHELIEGNYYVDIVMPTSYAGVGETWDLGGVPDSYGIGTVYGDGDVFHLFQSSKGPSYLNLLEYQVEQLKAGHASFT